MFENITLELSLKPFKQTDEAYVRKVCAQIFEQWRALLKDRKSISVMLWVGDGSEILDYAGNMVVVDHGWGLKTWYMNLGTTTVAVGDTVSAGDKVGTAGQSGFSSTVGAHIRMSVGDRFVSPYDTWADSEKVGKVVIAKIDELDAK